MTTHIIEPYKSLLLPNSVIFNNSTLLDNIHQSIIDLKLDPPKENIKELIKGSLSYLDNNLNKKALDELIILIFSCLSKFHNHEDQFFEEIYNNSCKNSNRLIFFTHTLIKIKGFISFPKSISFIKKAIKQIFTYIQNINQDFTIFGIKIGEEYKADFICDILLTTKFSEKVISSFFPYVFSLKNLSQLKKDKLIKKVQKQNLLESLPGNLLYDKNIFKILSQENLSDMIPKMNDQIFTQTLSLIEANFSEEIKWIKPLITAIVDKCVEFNIDFKLINKINKVFENFDESMMKPEYWNYFAKNEVILSDQIACQIHKFPDKSSILKVMPSIESIPFNLIVQFLLETDDFEIFERAANFNLDLIDDFKIGFCSEIEFWIHIFKVISNSKIKYSKRLIILMSKLFENNISSDRLYEIFDAMIFQNFPTSHYGNYFLYDLLNEFGIEYSSNFIQNLDLLLTKIIEMKVIPLSSFWLLFDFDFINRFFDKDENVHPLMLCAYKFSYSALHSNNIEKLNICPSLSYRNQRFINDFLRSADFNKLINLDDEMISFISTIEIFTNQMIKPEVKGLNEKIILPFIAVSLYYIDEFGGNLLFESNEISELFLNSCESLSENIDFYQIMMVDSIISYGKYIINESFFPNNVAFKMFDIFINQYIDKTFKANKSIFMKQLIDLLNKYSSNTNVKDLFEKNGINLIKFYFQNISQIEDLTNLPKINLKAFNQEVLITFLKEIISKSSKYEYISNAIYFIENFCENIPKMKITNLNNFITVINKSFEKNEITEFIMFNTFILKNIEISNQNSIFQRIQIPIHNINNFIEYYLKEERIEKENSFFEILFHVIIKDKTVQYAYITTLLEKVTNQNYSIELKKIIEYYSNEYSIYGDLFVNAIIKSYGLHSNSNLLIKKFNAIAYNYSNVNEMIINKFLNEANTYYQDYQALFCLKNIVLSFPFLFDKDPVKMFNAILPQLDSFSLIYSNNREMTVDQIKMIKKSILAQSIIYSSLYSVKVLEAFISWLFNNFQAFSYSQNLCFIVILNSLFHTAKIKDVLFSSKHSFPKIAVRLLWMYVVDDIRDVYNTSIYDILIECYSNLNSLYQTKKLIMIEKISESNKPISLMFNNSLTIFPIKLSPLNLPHSKNNEINEFISKTYEQKQLFIENVKKRINNKKLNELLLDIKKSERINSKELSKLKIPSIDNVSTIKFFSEKPNWIYEYIIDEKPISILKSHHDILQKVINDHDRNNKDKYPVKYNNENQLSQSFISSYCINEIFDFLVKEITPPRINESAEKLFKIITQNANLKKYVFDSVRNYISYHYYETDSIKILLKYFNNFNSNDIDASFLIDFALSPEIRNDFDFISFIIKNIQVSNFIPYRVTHLIGLSLIHNPKENISEILKICRKIGQANFTNILSILENSFNKISKDTNFSHELILEFVEVVPYLGTKNPSLFPLLMDEYVKKYRKGENVVNQFCELFNSITPERKDLTTSDEVDLSFNKSTTNALNSNNNERFYIIKQVPDNLVDMNPQFWNHYMKYRWFINDVISKNKQYICKFKFLMIYPELTTFDIRLSYFRQNMRYNYSNYGTLKVEVSRDNILVDSFGLLNKKSRSDWLKSIRVRFLGEVGIDAGGLTKEWFTLVTQELFNPNLALFNLSENKSYQPNPFSGINQSHLEYFKFAGKFIARALIQGQCVNAHFTQSFRRQILHTKVKLRDYEDIDQTTYNSMKSILENDVDSLYLNFTIIDDQYGEIKTVPLKENGENIDVTNENKNEYVSLYINYRLRKSIINQVTAFCEGFNWLIPHDEIKCFSQSELDLLICGIPKIDLNDMKNNMAFGYPYNANHRVIKMFFNVLSKWSYDDLAKLLLFITGSSQVPVNGFRDYMESGNPIRITRVSDKSRLCVAHTCFNTLDLPEYDNENDLNDKLLLSIQECEFGLG